MKRSDFLPYLTPTAGLAAAILVPSTAVVQKYFGAATATAYLVVGFLLLIFASFFVYRALLERMAQPWLSLLSVSTMLLILLFAMVLYPIANSGRFGGGSDSDDALMLAGTNLLEGNYPYDDLTYLNNPISPMPGAVLLALPFVLLGSVAYQNVFWLAVFLWLSGRYFTDRRQALLLFWTILGLAPAIAQNLATGGDYMANSIYVLFFAMAVIRVKYDGELLTWTKLAPLLLFGIALSSRANFLLLLPLTAVTIANRYGWPAALRSHIMILVSFLIVTLPFYIWNPTGFSPMYTINEVAQFSDVMPASGVVILIAAVVTAVFLAARRSGTTEQFLANAAVVQSVFVICGTLLLSLRSGTLNWNYAAFGIFFLFFGALAAWPAVWRQAEASDSRGPQPACFLTESNRAHSGANHVLRAAWDYEPN